MGGNGLGLGTSPSLEVLKQRLTIQKALADLHQTAVGTR